MSNRSDYNDHLMFSLKEFEETVIESQAKLYQCLVTFAAGGDTMSESMFTSLMKPVELAPTLIERGLAHFDGMGLFTVTCDCGMSPCGLRGDYYDEWYSIGQNDLTRNTETYTLTRDSIETLKEALDL